MEIANPYIPENIKIEQIIRETADTSTFRIKKPSNFDPGRFMQVSLTGIGEAPISVCSYNEAYMELCIRKVGRVTQKLLEMKEGQKIGIRGPYGNGYPLKEFLYKNLLIIGGGTGAAPLRGVIEYISMNQNEFKDVNIFMGFRNPAEILFKRDIKKWKDKFKFHITVDTPDEKWKGSVGVITKLLEAAPLNRDNTIAVCCGPPVMIKFVTIALRKAGFEDSQVYVSMERLMKCGIGKCGHCLVQSKYICRDGPVFNYETARNLID